MHVQRPPRPPGRGGGCSLQKWEGVRFCCLNTLSLRCFAVAAWGTPKVGRACRAGAGCTERPQGHLCFPLLNPKTPQSLPEPRALLAGAGASCTRGAHGDQLCLLQLKHMCPSLPPVSLQSPLTEWGQK